MPIQDLPKLFHRRIGIFQFSLPNPKLVAPLVLLRFPFPTIAVRFEFLCRRHFPPSFKIRRLKGPPDAEVTSTTTLRSKFGAPNEPGRSSVCS